MPRYEIEKVYGSTEDDGYRVNFEVEHGVIPIGWDEEDEAVICLVPVRARR